jgi:hypothetical protein
MNTGRSASGSVDEKGTPLAGPAVVRMLLGARMRRFREASGITCADAGYAIRGSHSKISRMELGRSGFKRRDVADLLTLYGVSDHVERDGLFSLVEQANSPGWLHEYGDVLSSSVETRLDAATKTLDFSVPIALMLSGIMGHVADDEGPHGIVRRLVDRLPPGSYLMLQDGTVVSQENAEALEDYNQSGAVPYHLRTPDQIAGFFAGLELVEPGVVPIQMWRPDVTPAEPKDHVNTFGGVGLKR